MKKIRFLLLVFVLAFVIGCGKTAQFTQIDYSNFEPIQVSGVSSFNPTRLEDLENQCAFIVKGTFADDAKADLQYGPYGSVAYGCTISTFKVNSIYKGALKAGDEIRVSEPYYISTDKETPNTIFYFGNYYPSDPHREYALFLKQNSAENERFPNVFFPVGYEKGRYPVISSKNHSTAIESYSNSYLNLADGDSQIYRSIYAKVIDRYMN